MDAPLVGVGGVLLDGGDGVAWVAAAQGIDDVGVLLPGRLFGDSRVVPDSQGAGVDPGRSVVQEWVVGGVGDALVELQCGLDGLVDHPASDQIRLLLDEIVQIVHAVVVIRSAANAAIWVSRVARASNRDCTCTRPISGT